MGSLHEFAAEFNITLGKARRMEKRGWLRIDSNATPIDEIRLALKKGARLTVAQLVELVENPGGLLELGNYMRQAQAQLDALGDPKREGEPAPPEIAALLLDAYRNEPDAVAAVAAWVVSILPAGPVGHAFVASRLLLGVPENIRKFDVPRLQRVLMNCRHHPTLKPHWFTVREMSRNVTYYQKQSFDI
jgi:hypothetical protein